MKNHTTQHKLAAFGRELLSKNSYEDGLPLIVDYVKEVIGADRCSIFIYDKKRKNLWTTVADGVTRIDIDTTQGIVGYTLREKQSVITNNAYTHPEFLSEIDKKTGYVTKSIITAPIFNSTNDIIGVLELLNKEGGFDMQDMKFMSFFTHYISGFLELVEIYEKV